MNHLSHHIESQVTVTPEQIPEDSIVIMARHNGKMYLLGSEFGPTIWGTINNFRLKSKTMETLIKQYELEKGKNSERQ